MAKDLQVIDGVECSVETGLGWVTKVDPPKGRNAHVTIRAEHLTLEVKAWVDTADVALYNQVLTAARDGLRVGYRIVVKRRDNAPQDVPLEQVPKMQRVRDLAAVEAIAGDAPAAAPSTPPPAQDAPNPAPTPDRPADAESGPHPGPLCPRCSGALAGSPARKGADGYEHVTCPGAGTAPLEQDDPAPDTTDDPPQAPATTRDGKRGPRIAESKPWEAYNTDGSLNLGSYAVQAAEGMVLLAHDLLLARARTTAATDGKPFTVPTDGQIRGLARRLLRASDRAQAAVRDDGHAARMASSHTRARAAVRSALEAFPVPWGADADALKAWELDLAGYATTILRVTIGLVDREPIE